MTAEAKAMASNESAEGLAQRLLEWERRARDAEDRAEVLSAALEGLREPSVQLAETVENRDDLPIHKWAIKCARLVSQVRKAAEEGAR